MLPVAELARMYRQRVPSVYGGPPRTPWQNKTMTNYGGAPRGGSVGMSPRGGVVGRRSVFAPGAPRGGGVGMSPRGGGVGVAPRGGSVVPSDRTGPRGTTTQDLIDVARFGVRALPRTVIPQTASPYELPENLGAEAQSAIIGGPGPGYGEKYGGFPTAAQWEEAILGEAMGAYELADLAKQQAQQAGARYYDELTGRVAERVAPIASLAGVRPGANLSAQDREKLMAGYQGVQEFGRTPEYLAALDQQNADKFGLFGQPPESANQIMRRAYESMLNAPNLDVNDRAAVEARTYELGWFPEEQALYERRLATDPYVAAPQQLAAMIESTPLSQYAQQIAVARYGMDPALAAGMFGPQADINYQKMMNDAELYAMGYTGDSTGEFILRTRGPEAYQQYMTQLADDAMYGSEAEQQRYLDELQTEENRVFDQEIASTYGFYPEEFGEIPAEEVRLRANDPMFQDIYTQSIDAIMGGDFNMDVAETAYQNYLTQTGDSIGARILQEAISKFDFIG